MRSKRRLPISQIPEERCAQSHGCQNLETSKMMCILLRGGKGGWQSVMWGCRESSEVHEV